MKNKRGSHVEVILSFVIFVTFLLFMYFILKPAIQRPTDKEYLLSHVEEDIKENSSSEFSYDLININETQIGECFVLELDDYNYNKIIVKNASGAILEAGIKQGSGLLIPSGKGGIYRLYYNEYFPVLGDGTDSGCRELGESEYELIETKTTKYISLTKIYDLNDTYGNNYVFLKEQFGVPDGKDFAFIFKKSKTDTTPITAGEPKANVNIYAEEIPVPYIENTTAIIKTGFLTIKVW
jgi:hypothetical protein